MKVSLLIASTLLFSFTVGLVHALVPQPPDVDLGPSWKHERSILTSAFENGGWHPEDARALANRGIEKIKGNKPADPFTPLHPETPGFVDSDSDPIAEFIAELSRHGKGQEEIQLALEDIKHKLILLDGGDPETAVVEECIFYNVKFIYCDANGNRRTKRLRMEFNCIHFSFLQSDCYVFAAACEDFGDRKWIKAPICSPLIPASCAWFLPSDSVFVGPCPKDEDGNPTSLPGCELFQCGTQKDLCDLIEIVCGSSVSGPTDEPCPTCN